MTYSSIPLIEGLLKDTEKHLLSVGIKITDKNRGMLETILKQEFTKNPLTQKYTPTQVVNKFLSENYQFKETLTPRSFSEETFFLIMQWGIHKASEISNFDE